MDSGDRIAPSRGYEGERQKTYFSFSILFPLFFLYLPSPPLPSSLSYTSHPMHINKEGEDLNHLIDKVFIIIPPNSIGCSQASTFIETGGIKCRVILIYGDSVV